MGSCLRRNDAIRNPTLLWHEVNKIRHPIDNLANQVFPHIVMALLSGHPRLGRNRCVAWPKNASADSITVSDRVGCA